MHPAPQLVDDDGSAPGPGTKAVVNPVYRYYWPGNGAHFYTTDPSKEILGGWTPEGIKFYLYAQPEDGAQPIYRYMSVDAMGSEHYFTPNGGGGPLPGWVYQGIGFYTFVDQGWGQVPLYEYQSTSNAEQYFYTSNPAKENLEGYALIGPIGYVFDVGHMWPGQLADVNGCTGINYVNGGADGLHIFPPFSVGDYVAVTARIAKRSTCFPGGKGTLLLNAIGLWVAPPQ
jgi:hypothetical protein